MSGKYPDLTNRLFDRHGLKFVFRNSDNTITDIFIPFYQTPKITESKKPKYIRYLPLASNNQFSIYTGSESRRIKVDLDINFLHMISDNLGGIKLAMKRFEKSKQIIDNNFSLIKTWLLQTDDSFFKDNDDIVDFTSYAELLSCYEFIIGIFRESVKNDAVNPLLGPPIILLKFGNLYDNVYCVCDNFSIKDRNLTYDVATGVPLNMSVSFDLVEVLDNEFNGAKEVVSVEIGGTASDEVTTYNAVFEGTESGLDPYGGVSRVFEKPINKGKTKLLNESISKDSLKKVRYISKGVVGYDPR